MYKVYVTDHVFENLEPEKEILSEVGAELISLECKDSSELKVKAKDADALLTTYISSINNEVMNSMENLKVIVRYGIGYNTIDLDAATKRGIQVANVPDYCLHEVSDHAVTLTLDIVRKVTMSNNRIKQKGEYELGYLKPVISMQDAKISVIGFGRIGRLIAGKMAGFGSRINFYDPFVNEEKVRIAVGLDNKNIFAEKVTFEEAMETSDIIILQAPSTKENYHMMDNKAFGMMKKKPYVVNTARGELICNESLVNALKGSKISGAALDVAEGMPPVNMNDELLGFENVILTPHSAWFSVRALEQLQRLAATEVLRVLKGGWVKSLVNPQVKGQRGSADKGI